MDSNVYDAYKKPAWSWCHFVLRNRNFKGCKLFGYLCFLCAVILYFQLSFMSPPIVREISVISQSRTVRLNDNYVPFLKRMKLASSARVKKILLWTKYFGMEFSSDFYFFESGNQTFAHYDCEFRNCEVFANKSRRVEADAILFHQPDTDPSRLPSSIRPDQIKILYNLEPPNFHSRWKNIRNFFNLTMNYRDAADIPVKYGEIREESNLKYSMSKAEELFFKKKDKAIWISSRCETPSKREDYIRRLKTYYPVDIYGSCGTLRCLPSQSARCYDRLLKGYKFYLSFENSICTDYVTEKFFNVLNYDIVPVVFGGVNYSAIAPPNSYIDALSFPNPKDLAAHLASIGNNAAKYLRYFNWKPRYKCYLHPWMCDLCKKLHEPSVTSTKRANNNTLSWTVESEECREWSLTSVFIDVKR